MVDGRTPLPHGAQYSANSAAAMRTRRLDRRGYGLVYRWHPSGGLTVTPSIDASASGHWHGRITNGEIR